MSADWLGSNITRARGQSLMCRQNQVATVVVMALTHPRLLSLPRTSWTLDRLSAYLPSSAASPYSAAASITSPAHPRTPRRPGERLRTRRVPCTSARDSWGRVCLDAVVVGPGQSDAHARAGPTARRFSGSAGGEREEGRARRCDRRPPAQGTRRPQAHPSRQGTAGRRRCCGASQSASRSPPSSTGRSS